MSLTRRAFLRATAGSAVVYPVLLSGQGNDAGVFAHGVASGDPLVDAVVIWTRVTPRTERSRSIRGRWQVLADANPLSLVRSGGFVATAERDYTVKIDVRGLDPGRVYRYQFEAEGDRSAMGRTKTLPRTTNSARLGVVSCSNYPAGFFNAYGALAARDDVDVVLHLGDYIYEYANGTYGDGTRIGRVPDPDYEVITLQDYRRRYAIYRRDPDLQELHRRHPMIAIWDDHELADNSWAGGPDGWAIRREAAMRAYFEWMPIREPRQSQPFQLYRRFSIGNLATLAMLDTRSIRDSQVGSVDARSLADPRRRMLGSTQERWLQETLATSRRNGVTWSLVGQQVMFSPFTEPETPVKNPDAWDGYQFERARLRELFGATGNTVVLTGDVHSSWAFDMPLDPWKGYRSDSGDGSVAVELTTPSVTSQPYFTGDQRQQLEPGIRRSLPHLKYLEGERHGYMLIDVTPARLSASWFHTPDVLTRSPTASHAMTMVVDAGSPRLMPG